MEVPRFQTAAPRALERALNPSVGAGQERNARFKDISAHDPRRGQLPIDGGVSAETLMAIIRHREFATTEKFTERLGRRRLRQRN